MYARVWALRAHAGHSVCAVLCWRRGYPPIQNGERKVQISWEVSFYFSLWPCNVFAASDLATPVIFPVSHAVGVDISREVDAGSSGRTGSSGHRLRRAQWSGRTDIGRYGLPGTVGATKLTRNVELPAQHTVDEWRQLSWHSGECSVSPAQATRPLGGLPISLPVSARPGTGASGN